MDALFSIFQPDELYAALTAGNLEFIGHALDGGWDIDKPVIHGSSLLHVAIEKRQDNWAKTLVAWGADINSKNGMGATALHQYISHGDLEMVAYALQNHADPNLCNSAGFVPLIAAIFFQNGKELIDLLLEYGADIDYHTDKRPTALIDAIKNSMLDNANTLIQRGANVEIATSMGYTALKTAIELLQITKYQGDDRRKLEDLVDQLQYMHDEKIIRLTDVAESPLTQITESVAQNVNTSTPPALCGHF